MDRKQMQQAVDEARSLWLRNQDNESYAALWAAVDATGLRGMQAHLLAMGAVRL